MTHDEFMAAVHRLPEFNGRDAVVELLLHLGGEIEDRAHVEDVDQFVGKVGVLEDQVAQLRAEVDGFTPPKARARG